MTRKIAETLNAGDVRSQPAAQGPADARWMNKPKVIMHYDGQTGQFAGDIRYAGLYGDQKVIMRIRFNLQLQPGQHRKPVNGNGTASRYL